MKRWLLIAFAVSIPILFIGYFWAQHKIQKLIDEKAVASGILQYKNTEVSLLRGDIIFEEAILNHDLPKQAKSIHITSPLISFKGISWITFIRTESLKVNELQLKSPAIKLKGNIKRDSLLSSIATASIRNLASIDIQQIKITDGSFLYLKRETDSHSKVQLDTVNINLGGFFLSNAYNKSPLIQEVNGSFNGLSIHTDNGYHQVGIQQITFNKTDSLIEISGLQVIPQYDKETHFQHLKYKINRLDFDFPSIKVKGWEFDKIMDKALVASKVEVHDSEFYVLSNQNLLPDPKRYKPLPQEALANLPFTVSIESVLVENGQLLLEVIGPGKTESGSLSFNPIKGIFTNVTNDSFQIIQSKLMEANITGWINGQYRVSNQFWMDLASTEHAFTFKGSVKELPFAGLNSFLKPCANVRFNDGQINQMDFEVNADQNKAQGNLKIDYDNLDFVILDENRKEKKILSKLINILFIKDGDKAGTESLHDGNVYAERDTTRSFFKYWWDAIQSGIKASLLENFALHKINKKKDKRKK